MKTKKLPKILLVIRFFARLMCLPFFIVLDVAKMSPEKLESKKNWESIKYYFTRELL